MKCALAATNLNGSLIQITCSMEGRMLLLRSRSRGIDDIDSPDSSAITNHRIKRSSTIEEKQPEVKKTKGLNILV
ncbi:hypothetical protein BLOT_009693 [Blomia tropicalis]|nr:hypothetical protein BLOT_009693 [Blomia tropicalis]